MEILNCTRDHASTYMNDIYEHYIGKDVSVITSASCIISGSLKDCNYHVLHIVSLDGLINSYVSSDKIIAIQSTSD